MIETVKGGKFPFVEVHITLPRDIKEGNLVGQFEVKLAGRVKYYKGISISIIQKASPGESVKSFSVSGAIPLLLSDFQIERPSLLFVKIDDSVPIIFQGNWIVENPNA